jgi:hypothetical protein
MSAPGRVWPGEAGPENSRLEVIQPEISELREQVEALLAWAETSPPGLWEVREEHQAFVASVSELLGVSLPLATFRSPARAASFLRVVSLALQGSEAGLSS